MVEAQYIQQCLLLYEKALGHKVDFSKSSLIFNNNTKDDMCIAICSILNLTHTKDHVKYLGLPSLVGKNKR